MFKRDNFDKQIELFTSTIQTRAFNIQSEFCEVAVHTEISGTLKFDV